QMIASPPKLRFAGFQRLLGALPVIDIDLQNEPAEDAALRIPHRQAENIEPTVNPINAAVTAFNVIGTTGLMRRHLSRDRALEVIRMDDVRTLPTFQLFECPAEIVQ